MSKDQGRSTAVRRNSQERAAKSERHDTMFFQERKKLEAQNIEKTMKLRALRMQKEAIARETAPAPKVRASRATAAKKSAGGQEA